jgi:small GTP-binding protein
MSLIDDQIAEIEAEIRKTQYNKATEFHIGRLKAKLAKLKREQEKRRSVRSGGEGYAVKKSGNATVAIVGYPSVGKSTILNKITNAKSETGAYDFTTLTIIPGIMEYNGAKLQLLDMPGIIIGASKGKGRGREVISVARSSDLILIVIDTDHYHVKPILDELYESGIRLNTNPPNIVLTKKSKGGIDINSTVKLTKLSAPMIEIILKEYRIANASIIFREDVSVDQLIDYLSENRVYLPALVVLNKIDLVKEARLKEIIATIPKDLALVKISAESNIGLDNLKDQLFRALNFIKIYLKPQNKPLETMVVKNGTNVEMLCRAIHKDFVKKFKFALVTGKSVKFTQQRVGLEHVLQDGDLVSIFLNM